ncbi:MAG TPA: tetratricopeptide repeat protein [Phycisphaerae bacterium]|jgi:tetratricopeptide (TPR) repeat protein
MSHSTSESAPGLTRGGSAAELAIVDVWSRTAKKYRVRAVVLLIVDIMLFAGLGCFAYWLRSGQALAPTMKGYGHELALTFQPWSDTRVALGMLLRFPIDQNDVPMQIPIHGLLLAALVSVPILISILYRFPACLPFLLVVAFLAMMPWLALTLLISCVLASVWPRFNFRYASAMLGLVPFIIYTFSASRQSPTAIDRLPTPVDQIRFMAPWGLAILACFVLMALCLIIARTVNYRPGAVAPLLAVLLLTPALMFEFSVGRDELYYRLLEAKYGPFSGYLTEEEVTEALSADGPGGSGAQWPEPRWQLRIEEAFARQQAQAVAACDAFIRSFPDSRYHLNALYIKAWALDTRVDRAALLRDRAPRFYSDFPAELSRESWTSVLVNLQRARRRSPMAAMAGLQLGRLDARDCRMQEALALLRGVTEPFTSPPGAVDAAAPEGAEEHAGRRFENVLRRRPAETSLKVPVESAVLSARQLQELLNHNRGDPQYGDAPLCGAGTPANSERLGFLLLNPLQPHYPENLRALLQKNPHALLSDNIQLEIAQHARKLEEKVAALESVERSFPDGDAVPESLFRLGFAYQDAGRPDDARQVLQRLCTTYPDSLWRQLAEARLRVLPPGPVTLKSE